MKRKTVGRVRVTSGSAGGLFLHIPRDFPSRPTQDKIKQAIFSSLGNLVGNASRVLDLYAGVGSLGIEALSRGAAHCTFVDKHRSALNAIKQNLEHCHLQEAAEVVGSDALRFCASEATSGEQYDLVFLDPPYAREKIQLETFPITKYLPQILTSNGIIIWEHNTPNKCQDYSALECTKTTTYGSTTITLLKHKSAQIT
ncbi:MAG: 16S rRNA (guanine(966)-N(2))-methyltransferase RsmD [Verrucomicrobiota bacterium]